MNYLKDGNCSISNNLAENSIRPFTIGRKNWLFSGSPKGASASAAVYSIIESAKANSLNPYKFFSLSLVNCRGCSLVHIRNSLKITFRGVQKFKKRANRAKTQFTRVFAFFISTELFDAYDHPESTLHNYDHPFSTWFSFRQQNSPVLRTGGISMNFSF